MFRLTISRALCPLATVAVVASSRYSGNQRKPRSLVALNVAHCENRLPKVDVMLPKCEPSPVEEVTMPDGGKYIGELQDGKRWGKGECWDKSGHYAGSWVDNVKCGMGVFKYHDGSVYEGIFDNDLPNKYGKMTLKDGKVFEGEFVNGALPGLPRILTFPWGHYEGDVLDGLPHGYGRKIYDNGDLVEGYFFEGKASGQVRQIDSDGDVWEGEFANDKLVSGKVTSSDGFVAEGTFADDKLNGKGRITYPIGRQIVGTFVNGVLNGSGQIKHPSGSVEEGTFVNGELHGRARVVELEGNIIETEYIHGDPQPALKIISSAGVVIIGTWAYLLSVSDRKKSHGRQLNALMHGPCTYSYPDGKVESGIMKFSRPYGKWTTKHPDGSVTVEDFTPSLSDRVMLWEKELRLIHWPKVKAALNNGKSD